MGSIQTSNPNQPDFSAAIPPVGNQRPRRRAKLAPWMETIPWWLAATKGVVLVLIALIMILPFWNVVAVSFSSAKDVMEGGFTLWPGNPTLESYKALLSGGTVLRAMRISILLTLFGTAIQVAFTTMMAYGLSKPGVPGSRFFFLLVLVAFMFQPGMIPSYLLVKELGMIDTYASLVVPGLIGAWNLIIMRNFFQNLPQDLMDAARIDGASDIGVFRHIALPLSKAVIAVIALFTGVGIWNTFFNAILYLNDSTKWPIQVVLRQYVLEGSTITSAADFAPNQPPPPAESLQMAMVVLATVPILLVYPFLQKYFAKGVLTGAIKG
jgi:ABC-type glycerol-3-phosphate transport system permease component